MTSQWLEELSRDIPVVLIGRHDLSENYDTVTDDDEAGTRLALDHLLSLGHERIAHLTIRMRRESAEAQPPHSIRRSTYEAVLREAGLDPLVVYCEGEDDDPYVATRELLLKDPSITAIFAGHDAIALEALRAVADMGLSAHDVSIVGYDDVRIAGHPLVSLTTVTQFGQTMGAVAIDLLMERIKSGRTTPRHRELKPELRVRSSTRPARLTRR